MGSAALISRERRPRSWRVLVIVFQFTTELFMTRHYGLAMVSFTPVILLMTQLAAPADPQVLILERGVETVVGAVVGILVVVLHPLAPEPTPGSFGLRGGPAVNLSGSTRAAAASTL